MNSKVKITIILLTIVGLGLYLFKKRSTGKLLDPNKLNEPLKSFYFQLKEKGYEPKTNPQSLTNQFVTFTINEGEEKLIVTVNSLNFLLIYDKADSSNAHIIKYTGDNFVIGDEIVSDESDLMSGVLEIVENKSYTI